MFTNQMIDPPVGTKHITPDYISKLYFQEHGDHIEFIGVNVIKVCGFIGSESSVGTIELAGGNPPPSRFTGINKSRISKLRPVVLLSEYV